MLDRKATGSIAFIGGHLRIACHDLDLLKFNAQFVGSDGSNSSDHPLSQFDLTRKHCYSSVWANLNPLRKTRV
jgi:hypothetical protein